MTIEKQLQEVIANNLPAATAAELQKHLEYCKQLQKAYEVICNELNEANKAIHELKSYKDAIKDIEEREHSIEIKRKSLDKQEQALNVALLEKERDMLKDNTDKLYALVDKVFGHPSVSVTTHRDIPLAVDGGGTYGGSVMNGHETTSETRTYRKE